MRILQVGADRSKRGILAPGSPAYERQKSYAEKFGVLDIIGFSLRTDPFKTTHTEMLRTYPTQSVMKFLYGLDALLLATKLPWPDVVSAQDPFETGLTALVISRFVGRPLHVQVHTDFLSPAYAAHSLINRIRIVVAGIVLRRAARVRVVSQRIKYSIAKRYKLSVPMTVLPIYVDTEKFKNSKPDTALVAKFEKFSKKLLFVGRLEPEKHPCLALRAFAKAAPQDACLIIVGTGSEEAYVRTLAAELGVTDRVFFEGEQSSVAYYPIAELVLVTSRYEGYGLVIVEALAAGKPVLSTDVGIAREAGAIVAPEAAYADALAQWLKDGPRTGTLGAYPYPDTHAYVSAYCEDVASARMR